MGTDDDIIARNRADWPPIEVRREQIEQWRAEARLHRREVDRWADDGGRA